jgi:maltose alpha-D-glucosyltransferase / alpha-amylase
MSTVPWFQDAVIYQLHVKTFQDSDGDGIGDFGGLIQRLDYLAELGVTALWLLPFYPSPLRDDGYDIADYLSVNPRYGTLEQFKAFLDAAHERGLRVVTELVLNHTSDQHPWFQRARRALPGSVERDFYVWSDTPDRYREARVIFQDFEPSNWSWDPVANAYFWHRFYAHQPDLNFENPVVHDELLRAIDFWLELGVDGVRLDAVPYLYEREGTNCENLPETHAFLRKLRAHIDSKFTNRMLLAEANQWPEDSAAYFGEGDECHMNFHFPLMPRLFMGLQMEDRFPIIDILEQTPPVPSGCQWAIFLRNHDELTLEMVTDEERDYMVRVYAADPRARINLGIRRRLAPLLGNNRRKIELINSLLLSLPGTPIIYYGDEMGMGDNIFLGDRDGVRTPMQWSPDRNGGFSSANPQRLLLPLIIDPEYHYETVNAENQQRNLSSLFWWTRRTLAVRRRHPAFARGELEFLQPENAKVLAFLRRSAEETILVVANLSRFSQVVELDLRAHAGAVPEELFGLSKFPVLRADAPMVVTLGPHGFYWMALRAPKTSALDCTILPILPAFSHWTPSLTDALVSNVFPCYFPRCTWFRGEGREVREFRLVEVITLNASAWLCIVEVNFTDGQPDLYLVPLARTTGEVSAPLTAQHPRALVAQIDDGGALVDALYLPEVADHLLRLHRTGGTPRLAAQRFTPEAEAAPSSARIVELDRANTSIAFGDVLMKVYRRIERGRHPEIELLGTLQDRGFSAVPALHGTLSLSDREGGTTISALTSYVAHQDDAWNMTLDALSRFFDRALESRLNPDTPETQAVIGGVYIERARGIAVRLAELHLHLASAFPAEPFGTLYQRSLYQAMRGRLGRGLRLLRQRGALLPVESGALANEVMERRPRILGAFDLLLQQRFASSKIRVHGDLHLGQVLNTGKDFVFIDFEGAPSQSLGERALKRCALVDVASLARSFDYAAAVALRREDPGDHAFLQDWAQTWVRTTIRAFIEQYFAASEGASYLPPALVDRRMLLKLFMLDRALREVVHELTHRPDLVDVPLRALLRLIDYSEVNQRG